MFQKTKTDIPVAQNAHLLISSSSLLAMDIAVDSSIVICDAKTFLIPLSFKTRARLKAYRPFLTPKREEVATAATALPPAAIIPITANCDAPEKSPRLKTWAWAKLNPLVTANAPNEIP